jgi:hypothetical protein
VAARRWWWDGVAGDSSGPGAGSSSTPQLPTRDCDKAEVFSLYLPHLTSGEAASGAHLRMPPSIVSARSGAAPELRAQRAAAGGVPLGGTAGAGRRVLMQSMRSASLPVDRACFARC